MTSSQAVSCPSSAVASRLPRDLISQKVFIKSFCKSQFAHKSVNLLFTITN